MDTKNATANRDFIYTIPSRVLFDKNLTDLDRKVYMIIRSFMDTTGNCYPSNGWLAEKFDVEKRSIPRSLARLLKYGYVKRINEKGQRYLIINYTPCPEEVVTSESPPHDPSVTPPMTAGSPNTSSKISKYNNINNTTSPSAPSGGTSPNGSSNYEYPETLYPKTKKPKPPKQVTREDSSFSLKDLLACNPLAIPEYLLQDWIEVRKKKKAALTYTAWSRLNKELQKFKDAGNNAIDAVEEMVARGWVSFNCKWMEEKKPSSGRNINYNSLNW